MDRNITCISGRKQKKRQYGNVAHASWISAPLCMSKNSPHGKCVPNAASHVPDMEHGDRLGGTTQGPESRRLRPQLLQRDGCAAPQAIDLEETRSRAVRFDRQHAQKGNLETRENCPHIVGSRREMPLRLQGQVLKPFEGEPRCRLKVLLPCTADADD